jgi:integrase
MAKTPHLHRRGNNFYFRVTVPSKLRPFLGCREIVKTLKTQNHNEAIPLALLLGSKTKSLFNRVEAMSDKKDHSDELKQAFDRLIAEHDVSPNTKQYSSHGDLTTKQLIAQWRRDFEHTREKEGLQEQIIEQKLQHVAEIKLRDVHNDDKKKAVNEALSMLSNYLGSELAPTTSIVREKTSPTLSWAIDDYISYYRTEGHKPMLSKIEQQLPMFLEIVGNKQVHHLEQSDINSYFEEIQKLPSNWASLQKKGMSLKKIINDNEGKEGLAEATVKKSYRAVLSGFIAILRIRVGLTTLQSLSTDKGVISYKGNKRIGYGKQRAITPDELKRLFEGIEMREFANDKEKLHMFWLPHIGLYTGARINEICQLNPQTDILEEDGVWYFKMTEDTDAELSDNDVEQSIKNHKERRVPVHSQLISLGLIYYVQRLKKQGAKRLFPAWKPVLGKASSKADDWFLDYIRTIGLRDETPFKMLVGFHAFRHTFMNHAHDNDIENYYTLSGHDDKTTSKVIQGYRGNKGLPKLKLMMEKFDFDIDFIEPIKPQYPEPPAVRCDPSSD